MSTSNSFCLLFTTGVGISNIEKRAIRIASENFFDIKFYREEPKYSDNDRCYENVVDFIDKRLKEELNFEICYYSKDDNRESIHLVILNSDYSQTPFLLNDYGFDRFENVLSSIFCADKIEYCINDDRDPIEIINAFLQTSSPNSLSNDK